MKKLIAVFLSLAMTVSAANIPVFAIGEDASEPNVVEEITVEKAVSEEDVEITTEDTGNTLPVDNIIVNEVRWGVTEATSVTTFEELKKALTEEETAISVAADITVDEELTIPEGVVVMVAAGATLRVLDTLTNNGTINGDGNVSVAVMEYIVETVNPYDDINYDITATKNGAINGTNPECTVAYDISLDGGKTWFADTTNGKAEAVLVKADGTNTVYSSFQSAFTSAKTGETVHILKDVHVQSTNPSKNNGPLRSYYGLILEGNGHTIYTDLEASGASNEYATIKFTSYLAGTGPEVNPVLKNVTVDSQNNAKADLDFVSGDVTFTVTMYNVNLLGKCQYASFAIKSSSFIINKSNVDIYDCEIPSWDAGSANEINFYSGEYSLSLNSKCTVYGGTYTKDVTKYLADGLILEKNEDGTFGVVVEKEGLSGTGTAEDPYVINTLEELKWFRDDVNAGNTYDGMHIKLAADIDLNNEEWTPIGTSTNYFKGMFDGDSHKISNLCINWSTDYVKGGNNQNYAGLFGYMRDGGNDSGIKNLTIENVNITACLYVGAILGRGYISGIIENCHVTGNVEIEGYSYIGGIVGRYEYSTGTTADGNSGVSIYNCSVIDNIAEKGTINGIYEGATYVGGILGFTTEPNPPMYFEKLSVRNISVTGYSRVGGISGIAHQGNTYKDCSVGEASIYGTDSMVGLIVGACQGIDKSPSIFTGNTVEAETVTAYSGETEITNLYGTNIEGAAPVTNFVAQIGSNVYETLAEALAAAQTGDTITLLKNINLGTSETILIGGRKTSNLTIDGDGHTITFDKLQDAWGFYNAAFYPGGTSAYNVKNLTIDLKNAAPGFAAFNMKFGGTLENVTVKGAFEYGINVPNANTITVKDCTFEGATWGIHANASTVSVNVTGTTFNTSGAVYLHQYGELTFTDNIIAAGSYIKTDAAVDVSKNFWNGNNATGEAPTADQLKGDNIIYDNYYAANDNGVLSDLRQNGVVEEPAIKVEVGNVTYEYGLSKLSFLSELFGSDTNGNTKITLLDNITLENGIQVAAYWDTDAFAAVPKTVEIDLNGKTLTGFIQINGNVTGTIKNGTVNNTNSKYPAIDVSGEATLVDMTVTSVSEAFEVADGATLTVKKGTYSSNPAEYLADGFACVDNGDGTFSVEQIKVAEIGDTKYATLAKAVAAAQPNDTITLLAAVNENVTIDKSITLDGADKNYTGNINISGNVDVTIQNVKFVKGYIGHTNSSTSGNLIVKDCSFANGGYAVTTERINSVTIEDCTVTNQSLLYAKLSTSNITVKNVNISGGNYVAHIVYNNTAYFENVNATAMTGYGIFTQNYGAKTITLKNCSFDTPNYNSIGVKDDRTQAVDTFIFQGENSMSSMYNGEYAKYVLAEADATLKASEGYDVKTNLEGYVVEYADGTYGVVGKSLVGSGTAKDPYLINGIDDLVWFRDDVNAGNTYKGKTVVLNIDIDLGNEEWTAIGSDKNHAFQGTFDGQNHTISNLKIDNADLSYAGLFGYASSAKINNVKINNVDIHAYSQVGAIAGTVYTGSVSNCHVSGTIKLVADYAYAGGITSEGYVTVSDCSVIADGMGEITVKEKSMAGAITGWRGEGKNDIRNCTAKNLNITAYSSVGAITGLVHYENTIDGCEVDNINLYKTRVNGQASIGLAAGNWSNKADDNYTITITNNSFDNITINGTAINSLKQLYGSNYSYYDKEIKLVESGNTYGNITTNFKVVAGSADDLEKAFAYANDGETITLVDDFELTTTIKNTKNITLDLNGYDVTYSSDVAGEAMINNNGSLTITDSSEAADGEIVYTYTGAADTSFGKGNYTISNHGSLIIKGGKVEVKAKDVEEKTKFSHALYTIDNYAGSTLEIAGGKVVNNNNNAMRVFAGSTQTNVTISDGEIIGLRALWIQLPGSDKSVAPAVNVTVSGGTLTAWANEENNADSGNSLAIYSYSYGNDMSNVKLSISGGTFNGDVALTGGANKTNIEKVEITGGTFNGLWGEVYSYGDDAAAAAAISITGGTFKTNEAEVYATDDGYKFVQNADGTYGVVQNPAYGKVAQIGDNYYSSLNDALKAANDGDTIELIWEEGDAPIAMNGAVYGNKTVTITGTADVDWSKGWLFVGRGGDGDGKLIFKDANLTSSEASLKNGSYGIHVSMIEYGEAGKNNGEVVFENSNIDLSYLMGKNNVTVDGGKLTVWYGFAVGARPASETNNVQYTATMNVKNGAVVEVKNHNGMGVGYESNGVVNVESDSSFVTAQDFLITANGTMNIDGGSANINGTLTVNGTLTSNGDITANIVKAEGATISLTGGTYTQDVSAWCALGYVCKANGDGTFSVERIKVAKIGDTEYATLAEAVAAAADDDTITVIEDHELSETVATKAGYVAYVNVEGKKVTIDLNGKKITASPSMSGSKIDLLAVFYVHDNSELVLTDSSEAKNGGVEVNAAEGTNVYSMLTTWDDNSKATIDSGNYYINAVSSYSMIYASRSDSITVSGGYFELGNANTKIEGSVKYPWIFNTAGDGKYSIKAIGGTYNINPMHHHGETYVPCTKAVVENADGTFSIVDAVAYIQDNEAGYATLKEALAEAEAMEGDITITLLADVEWETGAAHGSTPLISENATATSVTIDGQNQYALTATGSGVGPIRSAAETTVLGLKNLTVNDESVSYAESAWEFTYLEMGGKLNVENCKFTSGIMVSGDAEFTGCSFQPNPSVSSEYSVWVDDGNVSFTECTFTGNRALKMHEDYGSEISAVTVDKCEFINITAKPGIVIGDLNADTTVTVTETIMHDVKAGDQGMYLYESDTEISNFTFNIDNKTFVYENGVQVYPKLVAEVTDANGNVTQYATLAEAVADANIVEGGATVVLLDNVEVNETLTVSGEVTITDKNKKINAIEGFTGLIFEVVGDGMLKINGNAIGGDIGKVVKAAANYSIGGRGGTTYYCYGTFENAKQAAETADKTIMLMAPVVLTEDTVLDLKVNVGCYENIYPMFRIQNNANVTVKGTEIKNNYDYIFVLGASDGTSAGNLTIEDGKYYAQTTVASVTKGTLTVNGGEFSVDPYEGSHEFLLNCIDANYKDGSAKIVVKGGTFKNFNPANNAAEGAGTNFVAKGYAAIDGGNNEYSVEQISVDVVAGSNITAKTVSAEESVLVVASYARENGQIRLVDTRFANVKAGATEIDIKAAGLNTAGADYVKAFLIKDFVTLTPLCEADYAEID